MRNTLPLKIRSVESGIVNLDAKSGSGTHWTAYMKRGNYIIYFDSIGHLQPPLELIQYFRSDGSTNKIYYNSERFQNVNTFNCGHLCLQFLYTNSLKTVS